MISVQKQVVLGLGGILLAAAARADVPEAAVNPYHVIIDRNAFGLKPAPPPPTNAPPTNPTPPVKINLTGVTSDRNGKKAWMMVPGQSSKNTNPQYLTMAEHEKQGDIEVLEINEKEGTVKIVNAGQTLELNFKDNGLPTPAALPVPGAPGAPHTLPGAVPTPGIPTPGIVPAPGTPPPAIRTAGGTPNPYNPTGITTPAGTPTPTASTALRTIPARNVRTAPVETQAQATQPAVDPAVQRVLLEIEHEKERQRGIMTPPIPGR